jgi:spore maturation protein CgeB
MSTVDFGILSELPALVSEVVRIDRTQDILEQFEMHRPNLVLNMDRQDEASCVVWGALRAKGAPVAVWHLDQPYRVDLDIPLAPLYSFIFTNELSCMDTYRANGITAYYLPLGVSPHLFAPRSGNVHVYKAQINLIATGFDNRLQFVDKIADFLASKHTVISGWHWEMLKNFELLRPTIREDMLVIPHWLDAGEMSAYFSQSAISVNMHRQPHSPLNTTPLDGYSPNPRLYEINACAGFQLTDWRREISSTYIPGVEIETYDSPEEFIAKAEFYLKNEAARMNISRRGYERTLKEHTYYWRLSSMLRTIFG